MRNTNEKHTKYDDGTKRLKLMDIHQLAIYRVPLVAVCDNLSQNDGWCCDCEAFVRYDFQHKSQVVTALVTLVYLPQATFGPSIGN